MGNPINVGLPAAYAVVTPITEQLGEVKIYPTIVQNFFSLKNGQQWLRLGILISYSNKYNALLAKFPGLGVLAYSPTSPANISNNATATYVRAHLCSTRYCITGFNPTTAAIVSPTYSAATANGTYAAVTAATPNFHAGIAYMIGATLVVGGRNAVTTFACIDRTANGTAFTNSFTGTLARTILSGAVNAAGTLGVMYSDTAATNSTAANEHIWTSPDGTTWTARTGSGGTGTPIIGSLGVHWSTVGAGFYIPVTNAGVASFRKTTDGFTFTDVSVDATMTAWDSVTGIIRSTKFASSSAVTIATCCNTPGDYLRTTDGTTWTRLSFLDSGVPITTASPSITYDTINNRFMISISNNVGSGSSGVAFMWYVSTDGITWTGYGTTYDRTVSANISMQYAGIANNNHIMTTLNTSTTITVTDVTSQFVTSFLSVVNFIGAMAFSIAGFLRIR